MAERHARERLEGARAITPGASLFSRAFARLTIAVLILGHDHGFSNQRVAAFDQGWQRAEWNEPESGGSGAKSAAADGSGEADDSSAAPVP
jgi:hypothetical protein